VLKPAELADADFLAQCEHVTKLLSEVLTRHGGSISAEHGIGLLKKPYLEFSRTPDELAILRAVKQALDPMGILNPGKIFD